MDYDSVNSVGDADQDVLPAGEYAVTLSEVTLDEELARSTIVSTWKITAGVFADRTIRDWTYFTENSMGYIKGLTTTLGIKDKLVGATLAEDARCCLDAMGPLVNTIKVTAVIIHDDYTGTIKAKVKRIKAAVANHVTGIVPTAAAPVMQDTEIPF